MTGAHEKRPTSAAAALVVVREMLRSAFFLSALKARFCERGEAVHNSSGLANWLRYLGHAKCQGLSCTIVSQLRRGAKADSFVALASTPRCRTLEH